MYILLKKHNQYTQDQPLKNKKFNGNWTKQIYVGLNKGFKSLYIKVVVKSTCRFILACLIKCTYERNNCNKILNCFVLKLTNAPEYNAFSLKKIFFK